MSEAGLALYTHKINGLYENDFIMASKINRLAWPKCAISF